MNSHKTFTASSWFKPTLSIAFLFSVRMLGLFMLIPVFTVYAQQLETSSPILVGMALGIYGLSQAMMQIPFGMMSDRWGRKPMIIIGLCLLICGSLCGAVTHSIYGMIIARLLQGLGAIGSVLIALLADMTPNETRARSMAIIGATIGLSFGLAMVLSPLLTQSMGLPAIFYFTAILGCIGLVVIANSRAIHSQESLTPIKGAWVELFSSVIRNSKLQSLNLGIFCQHLILTATFYALPLLLKQPIKAGYLTASWHLYLGVMILSFLAMLPFIRLAEKKQKSAMILSSAVLITSICQYFLIYYDNFYLWCILLLGYFTAFQYLEASLPALISKEASAHHKGTAMGVYSSCQFLGIFIGGLLAGCIDSVFGLSAIFIFNAIIALTWFTVSIRSLKTAKIIQLVT
jgi:MFS family permease